MTELLKSELPKTKCSKPELSNEALSDEEILRYSRQILLDSWDIDAQLKLKNSRVLIIGAGGLGCPVSETLARAGVGHIHIIDDDVVEASNLQRQTLFYSTDIGQSKAQTACTKLQQINDFIDIFFTKARFDEAFVEQLFLDKQPTDSQDSYSQNNRFQNKHSQYDLIIDCTDNFITRQVINQASVRFQIPLLSASAIAMTGQLALFEPSKQTGCYDCLFGTLNKSEQTCATSGVLASTTTVMGNLQANLALQYLGRNINPLAGKLLMWNGSSMTQTLMGYQRNNNCAVCG